MLTYEEEQAIRDDFEMRYAEHVKSWCGLDEPVQELVARIKLDRDGRRYKDDPTNNAWTGFQLAPVLSHMSTPDFLGRLSRDQLACCIQLAKERLEVLRSVDKVQVWHVLVDDTVRFTSQDVAEALKWLACLTAAFSAAPDKGLLDAARFDLAVKPVRMYADEVEDWINGNSKPEDFAQW